MAEKSGDISKSIKSSQEILIQHIERYRVNKGLNYLELSNDLNIPNTTLSEILHGRRVPRLDTLDIMAKSLDVQPYELIKQPLESEQHFLEDEVILLDINRLSNKKKELLLLYLRMLKEADYL